jgi:peptidoglycan hydrolase-like protein with peptidoglycan-binding domain
MDVTLPLLKKGAKGLQVSMLQTLLNLKSEGSEKLAVDAIFGPKTEGGVRAWQEANDLHVDGIAGPKTWRSILEYDDEDQTIVRNI